jgi:hypothetical protein
VLFGNSFRQSLSSCHFNVAIVFENFCLANNPLFIPRYALGIEYGAARQRRPTYK